MASQKSSYFPAYGGTTAEQTLAQDLIDEQIKIHGSVCSAIHVLRTHVQTAIHVLRIAQSMFCASRYNRINKLAKLQFMSLA